MMNQDPNTFKTSNQTLFTQEIHLTDYLHIVWKRKWLVITSFLILVSLVTFQTFNTKPVYKATNKILIERQFRPEATIESAMSREDPNIEYYKTQHNLLVSENLALRVIKKLELWNDSTFHSVDDTDVLTDTSDLSDSTVHSKNINSTDAVKQSESENATSMVGWYLSNLNIEQIKGSQIFNISFTSTLPEVAQGVANSHAHTFIEQNIQTQYKDFQQSLNWLNVQIEEQKKKVEASERSVHEYKKDKGIVFIGEQDDIISRKLAELNNILIQASAKRIERQTAYDQLDSFSLDKESIFSLPEIKDDSVIQKLRSRLTDLNARKIEMSSMYRSKHPKIMEINSSVKPLEQEITNEVQRVRNTIKAELDRAIAFENSIKEALDEHKNVTLSFNEKNINFNVLQREAQSTQNIFDILLRQASEVNAISSTRRSNVRIVDEALLPTKPIRPKKTINILLSVVFGLAFGFGAAYFVEYMDKSVKTPEDVSRRLGMNVLGMVPLDKELKKGRTTLVLSLSEDESNYYKENVSSRGYYQHDISTNIIPSSTLMQPRLFGHVIMVESTTAGEGKSTVLARSAINLARGGLRVVMVDADVHRPSLNKIFKLNGSGGKGLTKTMSNIINQKLQNGTLDQYSLDDLFFLINLKKQSGKLTIINDNQSMTAIFDKGNLFHLQNDGNIRIANRLGTMLLRGGFITEDQLKDALERNNQTGQPLGYILLNAGYLNQTELKGPLKLQMEEHLQKLFSWKQGTFTFMQENVTFYKDKKINFREDYLPLIKRLGLMGGSRFLENEVLSCLQSLDEPNLSILPAGTGNLRYGGMRYFMLILKFLDILKQHFDVVLVDAPPLLDTMNGFKPLFPFVDGVIFVIKQGHASIKDINEAISRMKESNTKIIGVVMNQIKK